MPRPRLGVIVPRDLPIADLLPFALRAEEIGLDEIWVVEDCFFRGGIAQAATILARTQAIRVGIGILPAAVRSPAMTALEAGTLAELHPGRLLLGIGHGMPEWMRQIGVWPKSPLTLLEETTGAVRALLHGERLSVDGRYVHLDDVALYSPPAVAPPVLNGVRGPRSLEVAGRVADGTILDMPVTPEYLGTVRAAVERGRASAGTSAPPEHTLVAFSLAVVHDDVATAREIVRPARSSPRQRSGNCATRLARRRSSPGRCPTSGSTSSRSSGPPTWSGRGWPRSRPTGSAAWWSFPRAPTRTGPTTPSRRSTRWHGWSGTERPGCTWRAEK